MKLIVGLGNPGEKYHRTRHNFGFMVLDQIAQTEGFVFKQAAKYTAELAVVQHVEYDKIFYLKPQTYMNLSGQSVAPLAAFYKIVPEDILVIYDDIDLPLGKLRLVKSGGAGGHNGIKSMIDCLGSQQFHRLKTGIGRPDIVAKEVSDHVLEPFTCAELSQIDKTLVLCAAAVDSYLKEGLDVAMNRYNGLNPGKE